MVLSRRRRVVREGFVALLWLMLVAACSSSGAPVASGETETVPDLATATVAPVQTSTVAPERVTPALTATAPIATATPEPAAPTPAPTSTAEAAADCVRLTDFAGDGETALWRVVNDGVMGGLSSGGPTFADSTMRFAGEINTNGGGFSSVRLDLLPGTLDGISRVLVRARTDGRTYKLTFDDALANRDRRISHQVELIFDERDDWQVRVVSFADLSASLFGRAVVTDAFRPDLAIEMGVMISDGIDGPFQIDIDWIDACK